MKKYFIHTILITLIILGIVNIVQSADTRKNTFYGTMRNQICDSISFPTIFFDNATATGFCYSGKALSMVNGGTAGFSLTDAGIASVNTVLAFTGSTQFNITSNYNNTFTYPSGSITWATDGSKGQVFGNTGNGCLAIQINGTWSCQ